MRLHKLMIGSMALAFMALPILFVLLPQQAASTDAMMATLPASNKFKCAICHNIPTPTPADNELNAFGVDFRTNLAVWNQTLALMNSDKDRCANGFELGDADGDGVVDNPHLPDERSNPGDPTDCSIALLPGTWGIIKEIFRTEIPADENDGIELRDFVNSP